MTLGLVQASRAKTWTNLSANNIWETQGESEAKPFISHPANPAQANLSVQLDRAGLVQFWEKQHAAIDATPGYKRRE
jgi:hypothetical protein